LPPRDPRDPREPGGAPHPRGEFVPVVEPPRPDPIPNFRQSKFSSLAPDKTTAKWIGIGTGIVTILGACSATSVKIYQEIKLGEVTELRQEMKVSLEKLQKQVDAIEARQGKHLEACDSFRKAEGAAWRMNPKGEVIFRGVNQDAYRVWSESLDPPAWRISEDVKPLPEMPSK